MAQTFSEFLSSLKADQIKAMSQKALTWFLTQIKTAAQDIKSARKDDTEQKTTKTIDEQLQESTTQRVTPEAARQDVQTRVISFASTFTPMNVGKMTFFRYDPKLKQILPYYDMYPLIFPLKVQNDRTLGINLHYLHPYYRAKLMAALYALINNNKMNALTRLVISYNILNESSRYKYFRPCVKMYLHEHLRSRLMIIHPKEWNYVLFLPIAQFAKASESKVWSDAIKKVKGI